MILKNMKLIRTQYFTVLKNCNKFSVDHIHELSTHLNEILDSFFASPDQITSERLGEPLRQCLIFAYNQRHTYKAEYAEILSILKEKKLLPELCKANAKVEKNVSFISDCIKILVLMIDASTIERLFTKNLERLSQEFTLNLPSLIKNATKLNKNLRDLDTVLLFVDSFNNIDHSKLYGGVILFLKQLFETKNQQIWKRAISLAENLVKGVSFS
jgi:hypothetical protein